MAANPAYAATPKSWAVTTPSTTPDTAIDGTNASTLVTAGASGSRIEEIRIMQIKTIASTYIVNLFVHDGSAYHAFDFFSMPANTLSVSVEVEPLVHYYSNLVIPTSWSVRASVTVITVGGAFKLTAFGGDF